MGSKNQREQRDITREKEEARRNAVLDKRSPELRDWNLYSSRTDFQKVKATFHNSKNKKNSGDGIQA